MKKKHARDIPDFSHKDATKHGNVQPARELGPHGQRPRQVVTPKPVAKPNPRGQ